MLKVVSPVFMPIVAMGNGKVSHYEALARTSGPRNDHVRLIELGEEYGFVFLIDMAMMQHCFVQLEQRPDLVLAANISVRTIEDACSEVLSLIFRHMELVDRMIFEITETQEIRNARQVLLFAEAIRLLGGRIAMDDFGAGFFTVALIEKLRPEFLKLDRKLVADLHQHASTITQLVATVSQYGGEVIAEHVDSEEKLVQLRALGVHYAQGYLVGEPGPLAPLLASNVEAVQHALSAS